jgi:hypothetical protein
MLQQPTYSISFQIKITMSSTASASISTTAATEATVVVEAKEEKKEVELADTKTWTTGPPYYICVTSNQNVGLYHENDDQDCTMTRQGDETRLILMQFEDSPAPALKAVNIEKYALIPDSMKVVFGEQKDRIQIMFSESKFNSNHHEKKKRNSNKLALFLAKDYLKASDVKSFLGTVVFRTSNALIAADLLLVALKQGATLCTDSQLF